MEIPKEQNQYKREVKEGIRIVDESFKSIEKTKDFPEKKRVLDKAFTEALGAVGDAARGLMNDHLLKEKQQLEKDYLSYMDNPSDPNRMRVEQDIENLKKSAG